MLNNGGAWFKFLKPFTAEKDGAYAIDLAFNLDGQVKGGGMSNVAVQYANGVGINVPMLKVVPVPRNSGDTTKVE
uniref:hypothetical protein n=1 Tax=Streptobacillus moniliformis TaxID=34105 RepID=UPI0012DABB7C